MASAALGSLLICADLVGILQPGAADDLDNPLPKGVSLVSDRDQSRKRLSGSSINRQQLLQAVNRGKAWMDKNYKVKVKKYNSYYLYALERYKSLQAELEGDYNPEPDWYNDGVKYLMETKYDDGSWNTGCGAQCDTAFSILFLIRSMQSELSGIGDGAATSGRGLPVNIKRLQIRGNELVTQQTQTKIDTLLQPMTPERLAELDKVIRGDSMLQLGDLDEKSIRRFKQLVRSGEPAARIVAVKALGQTGDFEHVPTLLYALNDKDPYLVREARDALRFISRRFDGFGLEDEFDGKKLKFTRSKQMEVVSKWVKWYSGVRPDVPVVLE